MVFLPVIIYNLSVPKVWSISYNNNTVSDERTLKNFSSFSYLIPADTAPAQLFRQDVARQCRSVRISVNTFGAARALWDLSLIGKLDSDCLFTFLDECCRSSIQNLTCLFVSTFLIFN